MVVVHGRLCKPRAAHISLATPKKSGGYEDTYFRDIMHRYEKKASLPSFGSVGHIGCRTPRLLLPVSSQVVMLSSLGNSSPAWNRVRRDDCVPIDGNLFYTRYVGPRTKLGAFTGPASALSSFH